jgi:hypothetical protein
MKGLLHRRIHSGRPHPGLPGGPAEGRGGQRPPFGAAEYNLYDNLQTPIKKYIFYGLDWDWSLGIYFLEATFFGFAAISLSNCSNSLSQISSTVVFSKVSSSVSVSAFS